MTEEHFDAIVVGSGFGGSVTAYRLAEAGWKVCLLERGKPYPPSEFARSPAEMHRNLWDPSKGLQGLFDVWSFRGTDAVVSSGLGGGSLIYANVLLRKPEKWFVKEDLSKGGYEYWPVTRADLDPHYDRVEKMLSGQRFPHDVEPYTRLVPKTQALRRAAEGAGYRWFTPKLAVTFGNEGERPVPGVPVREDVENLHGAPRSTCRLCGECNVGCSFGSKNSLDYTYLSQAYRRHALEIRTRSEVRTLRPDRRGWLVEYVEHTPDHEGAPFDTSTLKPKKITANRVVISAGTYGSTYLLLRNRKDGHLTALSEALGTRVGGNGDFLSFAWKCQEERNGRRAPRSIEPTRGPVITSTVHVPDELDGGSGRGFYLQDAGIPAFVAWLAQPLEGFGYVRAALRFVWRYLTGWMGVSSSSLDAPIADLIGLSAATGATLPFLGMGRDVPDGRLTLEEKWLELDYADTRSRELFEGMEEVAKKLTEVLDGSYVVNPLYRFRRLITVHPLGGCPMNDDPRYGVVDSYGKVHGYEGLYVADGSVMPGPVGPNPALTIAALADRFADRMLGT